jgi:hypothetical protein
MDVLYYAIIIGFDCGWLTDDEFCSTRALICLKRVKIVLFVVEAQSIDRVS